MSGDGSLVQVREAGNGRVVQDGAGVVLAVELPGPTLLGWTREQLEADLAAQLIHSDDREMVAQARERVRTGEPAAFVKVRIRDSNGRWRWVEAHIAALADGDGATENLTVTSLRDVSEAHLDHEVVRMIAAHRSLLASAAGTAEAWQAGLEEICALAGARAAVVWESIDAGTVAVAHSWAANFDTVAAAFVQLRRSTPVSLPSAPSFGQAWLSGRPGAVDDSDTAESLASDRATDAGTMMASRLIPLGSGIETVALVELATDHQLLDDVTVPIDTAVRQLGDTITRSMIEDQLIAAEQEFRMTFEAAVVGVALVAPNGRFVRVNPALCRFLGRPEDEVLRLGFRPITHPDDLAIDEAYALELARGVRTSYQLEKRYLHADGRALWALLSVSQVCDAEGTPRYYIAQVHDIDERKQAEQQLAQSVATFRAAFEYSGVGMALVDLAAAEPGRVVEANRTFARMLGVDDAAIRDRSLLELMAGDPVASIVSELRATAGSDDAAAEAYRTEFVIDGNDGAPIWLRVVAAPVQGGIDGAPCAVVQMEDITQQRHAQERLAHAAVHDPLTGLPNRSLIVDRIRTAQQRSARNGNAVGILFIDLDKFKDINDSLGHEAGDNVLAALAARIRSAVRAEDTAARLGGDEFVVLCEDLSTDDGEASAALTEVAERIHAALREPFTVDGSEVHVTASIGLHVFSGTAGGVRDALGNADLAMYRAKARGRARTEAYDVALASQAVDRLRTGAELRHALRRNQLKVAYQPIVAIETATPVGAEALLRWTHPELGEVSPAHFIPIAEDSDAIVALGEFVIASGCRHLASGLDPDSYLTINVSARQLSRANFLQTVRHNLDLHGLDPRRLAIELTETVLMDAAGSSLAQLRALRELGVRIGVDDFGTRYASLTYLKQLPVTFLKIDRSFVDGLGDDEHDRTICDAILGLGRSLGLEVIAEGVETIEQANMLIELGCTYAQGYYYGRPAIPT